MILFLLPLLLNPFSILLNSVPTIYFALWPVILHTLGRDALLQHALVSILFILCCDITRQSALKFVGMDLISVPIGMAMLAGLTTNKGCYLLSLIQPIFSTCLVVVEPVFLVIEALIVLRLIKEFNKWLSQMANVHDEDSLDLSHWEPPLTRGSIVTRTFMIIIFLASYLCAYLVVQDAKAFLIPTSELNNSELNSDVPIIFSHAIAALVTLQLLAFCATMTKDEGIISESGMIVLVASLPIFLAAWSYHQLKVDATSSR